MSESAPAQLVDLGGRSVEVWQDKVEYKSDQTLGNFIPGIPIPHQLTEHCDQWGQEDGTGKIFIFAQYK